MQWTEDQVIKLAPDSSSASAGQSLASPGKWASTGSSPRAVWGACQGSGKDPYLTRIDLSEPAFKCSCPSRKFPCKHGLGLLLLYARKPESVKASEEPDWVSAWLAERAARAEKKAAVAAPGPSEPEDPEAAAKKLQSKAKREQQRANRTEQAVAACAIWCSDLMRQGLAAARTSDAKVVDRFAARMVDDQAPGLANFVRRIDAAIRGSGEWQVRTLDLLGRLHLLLRAAEKLSAAPDSIDPALAADIRTQLGYPQPKETALASPARSDRWQVAGRVEAQQDRLLTRRTWLVGRASGARTLVVDFAVGNQPMDQSLPPGIEFSGAVHEYPSAAPLRVLVGQREGAAPLTGAAFGGATTAEANLELYARALAANPWLERTLFVLESATLVRRGERWFVCDATAAMLPLDDAFVRTKGLWNFVNATDGQRCTLIGEWDGTAFLPCSVLGAAGLVDLGREVGL